MVGLLLDRAHLQLGEPFEVNVGIVGHQPRGYLWAESHARVHVRSELRVVGRVEGRQRERRAPRAVFVAVVQPPGGRVLEER